MTGRYQQSFGFEHNSGPERFASADFGVPRSVPMLSEKLKAAGYATGMMGKWHIGFREGLRPHERGFDESDRRLLQAIIEKFNGGPVGLNSLAAAISEEKDAIEDIYEPFLIQIGFLDRTPRGRVATPKAYAYFGLEAPSKESRLW